MRPAVKLSYLDEDSQRDIVDEIDMSENLRPMTRPSVCEKRLKKIGSNGGCQEIMREEKPNQREKIVLRGDRLRADPEEYTAQSNGGLCLQGTGALPEVSPQSCEPWALTFPFLTSTSYLQAISPKRNTIS